MEPLGSKFGAKQKGRVRDICERQCPDPSRRIHRLEPFRHPIDHHPQARRQLPGMGIEDVDRQRRRGRLRQHFDELAGCQFGCGAISWYPNKPEPHASRCDIGLRASRERSCS